MPVTSIQNIANHRRADLAFINTESSGNNREIMPEHINEFGN